MAAADDQADRRKDVDAACQAAGVDVRVEMIHGHERDVERQAQRLARRRPTSSEPARPGVVATAIASTLVELRRGMTQRLVDHWEQASMWAREAISGTTPPKRSCKSILRRHRQRRALPGGR